MRRIITSGCLFTLLTAAARFVPCSPTADFGVIDESAGKVKMRIHVRNADTIPQAILKVVPSCGCTAAEFQKDPVAPGDSAWIDLVYDPEGRPGKIEKLLRVYPLKGDVLRIPINGTVKATEETVGCYYPADGNLLHLSERTFVTLRPLTEMQRAFYADAYNSNGFPVWVEIENENGALESLVTPNPVPPYQKASIGLYVYPEKEQQTDITEYKVNLLTATSPEEIKNMEPVELKILFDKHGTP